MNNRGASIRITRRSEGFRVHARRPDLGRLVAQMPVDQALTLVPALLPICAEAQAIAAMRAAEAAQSARETEEQRDERRVRLLREQGIAAAWRLLVDWPRALEEAPELAQLKALRGLGNRELADGLEALLPGALTSADIRDTDIADCLEQVNGESTLLSERALAQAMAAARLSHVSLETLSGQALWDRSRSFLGGPLMTSGALGLATDVHATTVGPLAMRRHPAISELQNNDGVSCPARLLLAALLDIAVVARALREDGDLDTADERQRSLGPGIGLGQSMTIRGPLLHMVVLDDDDRVQHWRHLAPTDWHFAPGGLVERLASGATDAELRLLIAAADPCAPWEITAAEASDQEAA